ncbi:MAG: aminopeptidase P family protein [Betaproteobacteria bacterium]|nr:aminopeptidase P family protein [Betaproteobacteria bacterium]
MNPVNERACNPISRGELQRRWAAVITEMDAQGIDALLMQGANNLTGGGGYVRWFTGLSAYVAQPFAVLFARQGLMTLVAHGSFDEELNLNGEHPEYPGIGRRVSTSSFPAVGYTGRYDAEILAREIRRGGFNKVALVGGNSMYHGPISQMKALLPAVEFLDATDGVDALIAIKSPEEIQFIRQTAALQDQVLEKVLDHIKPGMRDFEVMAYAQYIGQLLGSESGYYLGSSAPPGQAIAYRLRPQQGRQIRDGDLFLFQEETTGPGGYFVHIARIFAFGRAPQEMNDVFNALVEAQAYTVKMLKPGASGKNIFDEYNAYMRSRKLPEETRLHCHGQGYPSVERPLIRGDETMPIAANMNIGIHPAVARNDLFVTVCDNFLTHADGSVERLHKTEQKIFEV